MSVLRQAYQAWRPLEPRISGDFPYAPYQSHRSDQGDSFAHDRRLSVVGTLLAERVLSASEPAARHALVRFFLNQQKFDDAARELTALLNDETVNAEIHNDLGAAFFAQGRLADALRAFNQAVQMDADWPVAWFNRALCHQRLWLLHAAEQDWQRYLHLETDGGWLQEARNHLATLQNQRQTGWEDQQQHIQQQFITAFDQNDATRMEQLVKDFAFWIEPLAVNQTIPDYLTARHENDESAAQRHRQLCDSIGRLLATLKGDTAVADAMQAYQALPRRVWAEHLSACRQYLQGRRLAHAGQYDAAVQALTRAASVMRRLGDPLYAERAELFIADNLYAQTKFAQTLDQLERVLPQVRQRNHKWHELYALILLGKTYSFLGYYSESLKYLQQALALEQTHHLWGEAAEIYLAIGNNQVYLRQYDSAIATYQQALALGLKTARPLLTDAIYQNIASAYMGLNDEWMASRYQQEVLTRKQQATQTNWSLFSNTLTNAAQLQIKLGDYEEARRLLNRALEINRAITHADERRDAQAFTLSRLGRLEHAVGRLSEAAAIFDQCRLLIGQKQERRLELFFDSAQTHLAMNQLEAARQHLEQAIEIFEQNRAQLAQEAERNFFFTRAKQVYDQMALLLYERFDDAMAALDYAERAKARSFLDLVSTPTLMLSQDNLSTITLAADARPRRTGDLIASLPDDVTLLQYAVTDRKILIWLLDRHQPLRTADVPVAVADVRQRLRTLRSAINQRAPLPLLREQAQDLYRILIEPIAPFLDAKKKLCIVPDDVLHELPFAALVSPTTGRYLIEDYPLCFSPSASIFLHCHELSQRKPTSRSRLLAVGNPSVAEHLRLAPLPFARQEIERIGASYPVAVTLVGRDATEDRIRSLMPQYDTIHFATHFLMREREPMFSALALAPLSADAAGAPLLPRPGHRDGLLQIIELYSMQLSQTSLVVLSACNSALGDFFSGEGLVGLTRPFIRAGVPTLVSSLWPIADSPTTVELMTVFHQRWRSGASAAAALRAAQTNILSGPAANQHPYYWAPFLVVGSGR
ncbi:MAG: CHAT domain-containing protein [Acidobacteriota bacterium]|nr:CHAT domain-containing protein [Acidobacteriota bacterium]